MIQAVQAQLRIYMGTNHNNCRGLLPLAPFLIDVRRRR